MAAAALSASCGSEPATPTGVLLISIDSLRADHLSCYGYKSRTRPEIQTTRAELPLEAASSNSREIASR